MALQALSLGSEVDLWRPQTGAVHSAFARAVNLRMNGEMWTVLGANLPDTPFGIRLAQGGHLAVLHVQAGDLVHVRAGYMRVGPLILDCRTASRWAPTRWPQPATDLEVRLAAIEQVARPRAWTGSAGLASEVTDALRRSDRDLARAVCRTVGRGPGLTPAGDDVLVGILAVLTCGASGPAGIRATARLVCALAPVLHSTPDVSRHLLDQAARGLPGRALHELGKAVFEGPPNDILANALDRVLDTGRTSGADACLGLAAASRFTFLTTERLAA